VNLRFSNRILIQIQRFVYLVCLLFIVFFTAIGISSVYFTHNVKAHPGNTASDGCHYCRTNCDYWGEVYGERHCHGGNSTQYNTGPSLTTQGNTNGASHARTTNLTYIESNASSEGKTDGYTDGSVMTGTATPVSSADVFCSKEVPFSTPQAQEYATAFQASYKSTCIPLYDSAYNTAYTASYTEAHNIAQTTNKDTSESKSEPKSEESNGSWFGDIIFLVLILGFPIWAGITWLYNWVKEGES